MPSLGLPSPLNAFSLPAILDELARSRPTHLAVACGDDRHDYRTLRDRVLRLAGGLEAAGVAQGDRILWLGQNSHRVLECVLAAACLRAMFCPVNWRQSASELAFVIDDLQPSVIFWQQEEIGGAVLEAKSLAVWRDAVWFQHDDAGGYEALIAGAAPIASDRAVDPSDPVLIVYTAAFEGRPNGALLSQTAILLQDLVVQRVQDLSHRTVFLNSGPLFHVGTLMTTFATFHIGGTNVFIRRSDGEELARTIHDYRCTFAFLVGKQCQDIVLANRDGCYDLKCLTSQPFFPEWDAMVTINDRDLRNGPYGYGQSEVDGLIAWTFYNFGAGVGTHGRVSPITQLRIAGPDGADLPDGEVGEILLRGPTVMSGYWNRPEVNTRRQRGGWHHTHDLGRREADGSVSFIGPKTQMIKSGVENIYPAEVEGCLKQHPAVADAAIIGIPDPQFVQTVKAIIQLKAGASVGAAELIEHCRTHMASYKKPRSVEFVDALPRTPIGFIDYRALDAGFGGGNYPGGSLRGS